MKKKTTVPQSSPQTLNLNEIKCVKNRETSDESIRSMASSIGNAGLINPITLRRIEKDNAGFKFEVLAGRCRYFALQLLERYDLPTEDYRVIETEEPELISFVENYERRELTITEEVEHLASLAKTHDYADIAAMIGRTEKYVRVRLNLNNLSDLFKKALADGSYPALKTGHYEIISRYPENMQSQLKNHWRLNNPGSVEKFSADLDGMFCRLLSSAPFPLHGKPDCSQCQKRSLAEPWLFDELKNKNEDRCLDADCWEKKKAEKIKADLTAIKKGKSDAVPAGKPVHFVTDGYVNPGDLPKGIQPLGREKFEIVKDKKAEPNAYIVGGDGAGTYCHIRLRDKPAATAPSGPKSMKDKRSQLQKRREKLALEKLAAFLVDEESPIEMPPMAGLLMYIAHLGTGSLVNWDNDDDDVVKEGLENLPNTVYNVKPDQVMPKMWVNILCSLSNRLTVHVNNILDHIHPEIGEAVCKALKLDWKKFLDEAEKALPEPKSWSEG